VTPGCAAIAHRKEGSGYSLPTNPPRIASRICPDLISGKHKLPKLILGVKFTDGLEIVAKPASRQLATTA